MPDYLPARDLELQAWLANFVTVANANLAALGLVAADLTPVTTNQTNFNTAIADVVTKQAALDTAVENKQLRRKQTADSVRLLAKRIQANPAVTNALKANLGLTVRDLQPTPAAPVPPTDLVVRGLDSGTNVLNWKRAGNKPGTPFVIEALIGNATAWVQVDVVTATKFSHLGQRPGVRVVYRVRARRGGALSEPGNEASVYAG